MTKHPAPWTVSPAGYGASFIRDANGRGICTVPPVPRETRDRDAALVERQAVLDMLTQVPTLVEALRGMIECGEAAGWDVCDQNVMTLNNARAVLANWPVQS